MDVTLLVNVINGVKVLCSLFVAVMEAVMSSPEARSLFDITLADTKDAVEVFLVLVPAIDGEELNSVFDSTLEDVVNGVDVTDDGMSEVADNVMVDILLVLTNVTESAEVTSLLDMILLKVIGDVDATIMAVVNAILLAAMPVVEIPSELYESDAELIDVISDIAVV